MLKCDWSEEDITDLESEQMVPWRRPAWTMVGKHLDDRLDGQGMGDGRREGHAWLVLEYEKCLEVSVLFSRSGVGRSGATHAGLVHKEEEELLGSDELGVTEHRDRQGRSRLKRPIGEIDLRRSGGREIIRDRDGRRAR